MRRYILTEYDDATDEAKAVYVDYMQTVGTDSLPIWLKSLGHNAALLKSYWERSKGTLFSGSLPLPLKEMIVFVVSARNGARYCSACHAQCVLSLDKALKLTDLKSFLRSDIGIQFPVYYQAVVKFADKVAENPNELTDSDFETLLNEGFSQEEICEIISVIDLATMFNVYTSSLQLDLDPDYEAIL
jgi:uncharacterized peroxidase-related enzyme